MSSLKQKKVFFVIGEESGDLLGADLLAALYANSSSAGFDIEAVGLGGPAMQAQGIKSLFDVSEIAVMGITAVLGRLPIIIRRILHTVAAIKQERPDLIVLIDSPDFTHAVAKRVRKKLPEIPIIDYVCPSVWAWRQGRARKMTAYIDHVLALLSFGSKVLKELGGPEATYVGHKLVHELNDISIGKMPTAFDNSTNELPVLLVLPGSRKGEVDRLLDIFGETVELMRKRGQKFECVIPAVAHLEDEIKRKCEKWPVKPKIVTGADNKLAAFESAAAALAASGTVSLELALAGVPMVLAYRLDPIIKPFAFMFSTWSAALPNLVADYVVVPEEFNHEVTSDRLVRQLERLLWDSPQRQAQIEGMKDIKSNMQVDQPPGEKAADVIFRYLKN